MGGSADFKIEGTVEGEPDKIAVYSDSDHGGDNKHLTTRSQSGTMILLNGVPVHWRSSKQSVTALSSAEAEIYVCVIGGHQKWEIVPVEMRRS